MNSTKTKEKSQKTHTLCTGEQMWKKLRNNHQVISDELDIDLEIQLIRVME